MTTDLAERLIGWGQQGPPEAWTGAFDLEARRRGSKDRPARCSQEKSFRRRADRPL